MSISGQQVRGWGPSHQYRSPPRSRKGHLFAWAIGLCLLVCALAGREASHGLSFATVSAVRLLVCSALGLGGLYLLVRIAQSLRGSTQPVPSGSSSPMVDGAWVRSKSLRLGGGAYLGLGSGGRWVTADPEHAIMVLGPPRSGKTAAIVIPSILAAPGPVVSTTTKPDVMNVTSRARAEVGQVWLYDPCGEQDPWPAGVRRLSWSPVPAASSWDEALLMARAMASSGGGAKGTTNEQHWRERSTALLAPLLYAAFLADRR